jgi:acetoin utilization deacetylase AcuC-like enzyme
MIINGECLNVFCATRPPGHHAGRELHAMKAVSNGFCILNSAACAALYAATPIVDGGLGLSRVCVVDIDVHHGNGTQDILCSTFDPRFLYVSMHAGGPDINGLDMEDDELEQVEHHLGGNPKKGIFPGRCGDISPHKGVLNIPLGGRVTSHALGTALVTKVTPAVEAFNPEIVIISAGFDAHKNDPLNMGGLTAEDFGTLTEVICKLAYKCCSGRVLSVMEGGYGVPCCRPQNFADRATNNTTTPSSKGHAATKDSNKPKQPEQFVELQCLDLGSEIPPSMSDVISSYALQKRLDKCHQEGFIHCVKEHVSALARCNVVKR